MCVLGVPYALTGLSVAQLKGLGEREEAALNFWSVVIFPSLTTVRVILTR